jgi:L-iditol 2-dehydrogenase
LTSLNNTLSHISDDTTDAEATLIHTHTFDMSDLPEAIRYAKDRVEDAIKVVVTNKFAYAKDIAAE